MNQNHSSDSKNCNPNFSTTFNPKGTVIDFDAKITEVAPNFKRNIGDLNDQDKVKKLKINNTDNNKNKIQEISNSYIQLSENHPKTSSKVIDNNNQEDVDSQSHRYHKYRNVWDANEYILMINFAKSVLNNNLKMKVKSRSEFWNEFSISPQLPKIFKSYDYRYFSTRFQKLLKKCQSTEKQSLDSQTCTQDLKLCSRVFELDDLITKAIQNYFLIQKTQKNQQHQIAIKKADEINRRTVDQAYNLTSNSKNSSAEKRKDKEKVLLEILEEFKTILEKDAERESETFEHSICIVILQRVLKLEKSIQSLEEKIDKLCNIQFPSMIKALKKF